jgi:hypothetical protein
MTTLRMFKKLLLGETWIVPIGVAATLVLAALAPVVTPRGAPYAGGAMLLLGVLAVLLVSVRRGAHRR